MRLRLPVARAARVLLPASLAIAIACAAVPAQAAVAGPPGWRIVDTIGSAQGYSALHGISASGPGNAWAVGVYCSASCVVHGEQSITPLVEHSNGTRWTRVTAPKIVLDFGEPSATAGGGFWAMAESAKGDIAEHWTGRRWQNAGAPGCGSFFQLAAVGPDDVWAFGGRCAARYTGRSWHKTRLPDSAVEEFSAVSASDIWVVGLAGVADKPPGQSQPTWVAMHWNGRSWHVMALPKVAHPAKASESLGSILAISARSVWVSFGYSSIGGCCRALRVLEHWNGRRWQRATIPYATSTLAGMIRAGKNGFWLLAGYGSNIVRYQRLYHYNGRTWSRTYVPAPAGAAPTTLSLAWIPGTTSAWGVASISPAAASDGRGQSVIYKYGA